MDSWDDDEFEVPDVAAVQTKVVASWEDEEEEEVEQQTVETSNTAEGPQGPLKPKHLKKMKLKEQEEKRAMEIAMTKARLAAQANETDAERKAREKASMEEADLEAALDAFAPTTKRAAAAAAGTTAGADDIESAMNGMRLISLSDHEKLGELVANRIVTSNAKYALEAIKVIITRGSVNLTADDMKDLTTIINVIKNDKIAAAKPKAKKKKQSGRQGYANVERDLGELDDGAGRGYDDFDDFM